MTITSLSACNNKGLQGGRAPVYQGMTVSDANYLQNTDFKEAISNSLKLDFGLDLSIGNVIKEDLDIDDSSDLDYFSARNQDMYITIRLSNPDSQVILRLKLNGVFYQISEFQPGTDSENIIIKVNSGDIPGVNEFTIDEIKYIENETNITKDAVLEGNRTIKVGVAYEVAPLATISSFEVMATSMSVSINIVDVSGLIEQSDNIIKAYVFDGNQIVQKKDLILGSNTVSFDNLDFARDYEYAFVAVYDLLDGTGKRVSILSQDTFSTLEAIEVRNSISSQNSISFEIFNNDISSVGELKKVILSQDEQTISEIFNFDEFSFDNLNPLTEYTFTFVYEYSFDDIDIKERIIKHNIITKGHNLTIITNTEEDDIYLEQTINSWNMPDQLIKEHYTFIGFYYLGTNDLFDENEILQADTIIEAKWEVKTYTISYYLYEDDLPDFFIALEPEEQILVARIGLYHSAFLTSTGRLFTWGANREGQLGRGYFSDVEKEPVDISQRFNLEDDEQIIDISLGGWHSAVLTSKGRVFTWGSNKYYGQLGAGHNQDSANPIDITSQIEYIEGEKVLSIHMGAMHSALITTHNRIFVWGENNDYLLSVTGGRVNEPIDITANFGFNTGETITILKLGVLHSILVTSENRVFAWGSNRHGQLGDGTTTQHILPIDITSQFTLDEGDYFIKASISTFHSLLLTNNGQLYAWGRNEGRLGNGEITDSKTPINTTDMYLLSEGEKIIEIGASPFFSMVITSNRRVLGHGEFGFAGHELNMSPPVFSPKDVTNLFVLNETEEITGLVIFSDSFSAVITNHNNLLFWGGNHDGNLIIDDIYTSTPFKLPIYQPNLIFSTEKEYNYVIDGFGLIREGYVLDGWYEDINLTIPFDGVEMPGKDLKLYGKLVSDN